MTSQEWMKLNTSKNFNFDKLINDIELDHLSGKILKIRFDKNLNKCRYFMDSSMNFDENDVVELTEIDANNLLQKYKVK